MSFVYHEPKTVQEVNKLLVEYGDDAKLLAGGTDLMVLITRFKVDPKHVISLDGVRELKGIRENEQGNLVLGAQVTHREVEKSSLITQATEALRQACSTVGGIQVRNMGTVGGNLCNASPAADTPPVLLALDASVTIVGPKGTRSLPLQEFLLGPRKVALEPGEFLTEIEVPKQASNTATVFLKAGRRKAMEISLCAVSARVTLDENGIADVRIGLGSVAPTAVRAHSAEALLQGKVITQDLIRAAGTAAVNDCNPISDVRGSAEYRRMLVESMVRRALSQCLEILQDTETGTKIS
ncbi:FAD binding domain-containing protein [Alkalihalobacterium alkalinitrilicum]|uniref:FAD binding domain-containing protein n=1 Tax=Alkalihalobacterium alkalinitrilicum TaxID=427920 RepID=UPI001302F1D6|nr:xanthine dehydrogenase family protein subunit M [Alkalihalobacterium alkalinitrilicum]